MRFDKLNNELKAFRDYVIKQARTNLTKLKKNSSKGLYDSLKGTIEGGKDDLSLIFEMEFYGQFQDLGVDGKRVKHGAPFSFKDKMPPPSALDKWIVNKGIAPRDKQGRFMTRKQTQFMIARGIFLKGIKPSLFFTKPFEDGVKRAGKDFQRALQQDVAIYMDETIKNSNSKRWTEYRHEAPT